MEIIIGMRAMSTVMRKSTLTKDEASESRMMRNGNKNQVVQDGRECNGNAQSGKQ